MWTERNGPEMIVVSPEEFRAPKLPPTKLPPVDDSKRRHANLMLTEE